MLADIPLFPLAAVLYPGSTLSLRIFESRYLDMVRECARNASGFGVCLKLPDSEAGEISTPLAIGTLACIVDFETMPDGLLGITVEGNERFRVQRTRVRDNGLLRGDAQLWPAEPEMEVPAEYGLLVTVLDRLVEKIGGALARAPRTHFDDASWVGFRLAELLPLALQEHQYLLGLRDPIARLAKLTEHLQRLQDD